MEAVELARWTRFAAKGGIGKCTAICDCVAENADDLMFLKDDEITVLMQLTDPSGMYLGYCEGVVGRFNGSDVHFHSKLKKPIMAKRSSVNVPTTIQNQGISPTPPYGLKTPSPMAKGDSPAPQKLASRRTRVSLDEQVSASITAYTSPSSASTTSPELHTALESGPWRTGKPRVSFSSRSESRSRERTNSEILEVLEGSTEQIKASGLVASPAPTSPTAPGVPTHPSPPTTFNRDPTNLLDRISQSPVSIDTFRTSPSLLQEQASQVSSKHASILSTYSQATASSDDAGPRTTITRLSPTNTFTSLGSAPEPDSPRVHTHITNAADLPTTSSVPDSSTSTYFDDSRISLALSDGEVGIGLSLLQDLADRDSHDGWSDSDSDEQTTEQHIATSQRASVRVGGNTRTQDSPSIQSAGTALRSRAVKDRRSVVSEATRYSSENGSDRLLYEDTETGHDGGNDDLEADITQTQQHANLNLTLESPSLPQHAQRRTTPPALQEQQQQSLPAVAPLSPSRFRFASSTQHTSIKDATGTGYTYEFPPPPTHTPQLHRAGGSTTSSSSVASTGLTIAGSTNRNPSAETNTTEGARRPSLAHSHTSVSSDWEGAAADIYDDYRYSRFSVSSSAKTRTSFSSSKRASVSSKATGVGTGDRGDVPPFFDNPEARSRADSGMIKPSSDVSFQSYGDAQLPGVPNLDPLAPNSNASKNIVLAEVQGKSRTRSRSNTTASLNPPSFDLGAPLHAATNAAPTLTSETTQLVQPVVTRTASRHRHVDSLGGSESDASVYTQSSVGNSKTSNGSFENSTPASHTKPLKPHPASGSTSTSSGVVGNRPAPLNLLPATNSTEGRSSNRQSSNQDSSHKHQSQSSSTRSPLLHTSWGSPLSSPVPNTLKSRHSPNPDQMSGNTSTTLPIPSSSSSPSPSPISNTGFTGTGEGFRLEGGGKELPASATYFPAGEITELGQITSEPGHSITDTPERTATFVRQDVVVGVPPDEKKDEPGFARAGRIVIEDDDDDDFVDQVASKANRDTPVGPSTVKGTSGRGSPFLSSPEPRPELLSAMRPVPLAVTDRTPSPLAGDVGKGVLEGQMGKSGEDLKPAALGAVNALSSQTTPVPTPPSSAPGNSIAPTPTPLSPSLPASLPRPSLPELRGLRPGQEQSQRQSLFLPHPNAPKAPSAQSPGPMYITQRQPPPQQPHMQQMRGGILQTIHMALANQGLPQGPTIYGITTADLSAATGPVLMHFSINPPPATAPPPRLTSETATQGMILRNAPPPPIHAVRKVGSTASLDTAMNKTMGDSTPETTSGLIPRANFFPKVGSVRPRSRSFSGFQNTTAEIPLPIQRSREEGNQSIEMPSANEIKRALSPIIASPVSPSPSHSPSSKNMPPKPSPLRVSSPLLQPHNQDTSIRQPRPPNSPLGQSFSNHHPASIPPSPTTNANFITQQAGQTSTKLTLNDTGSPPSFPRPRATVPAGETASQPGPRPSVDTDAVSVHSTRSHITSPQPTPGRHDALRSKLSLPNLRKNTSRQDGASDPALQSPVIDGAMLQVQDMDFELVRPNITHFQAARTSEDSSILGNSHDSATDVRLDADRLRSDTPMSPSPIVASDSSTSGSGLWQPMKPANLQPRAPESESSMDAHRQRELKWMSVLASVPASQSKKSKKVKKLLFEGVPSSVRYLVWSHLTDGKGRCVPGVYSQLAGRGKLPVLADVERDVQRCFADHPQLQSIGGSVLSLMQAYLTMVPDIQYSPGLTLTAGQLLLLAPEEDAFWIFVSIMDTHTRPYFRPNTTQIDIDALLFNKFLESTDPTTAKKMFSDLSIPPTAICRPWFTSLFIGSLPSDYLTRVWDIFLFEGIPFLFRVGLILISCCRRQILESTSQEFVINTLLHPSPSLLPSSPEAFVSLALDIKLKDDDVRKQRVKLEAQAKRQTQAPRTVSTPSSISLPRTG